MKVKDWIEQLEKFDPDKEVYFRQRGDNGADWGYIIEDPSFKLQPLEKVTKMRVTFIYPEEGMKNAKPIGDCVTLDMKW